jgi:hypothetical protein
MYLEDSTKEIIWIQQNKQEKDGGNYMKMFMICTSHQMSEDGERDTVSWP